jgi:hypothetical protein
MIQNLTQSDNSGRGIFLLNNEKQKAGKGLSLDGHKQSDRQSLERLLKLGISSAFALKNRVNLSKNEELTRLIPVLCTYFSAEELEHMVGERTVATIQDMYRLEMLQNLYLEPELQRILRAFNEVNIPLLLCKGPALAYSVYPQAHLRTYHDIDVLIHPRDLPQAHDVLRGIGYTFYEEYRSNMIDRKRVGYNYILKGSDSWLEALIELHTAPHESEFGTTFDIESLWQKAQPLMILGEPTLTMHPLDHLLYLCWHYRFHGFSRLIWLYDIVMIVRTFGSELDWDALVRMARHQRLATTLYYCLSWCRDLFAVAIPVQVFAQLRPPLACRLIVERAAMSDVAFALATPQAHPRRILAQRVMVDRSTGLLRASVRALFPVPSALARRYMDRSRLPLQLFFLFYLIHPWITLAKGCSYLLTMKRHPRGSEFER